MRLVALTLLALCLQPVAVAAPQRAAASKMDTVKFPASNGEEINGYLFRPSGDGPFPTLIAMYGCGGLFDSDGKTLLPTRLEWAGRLVEAGYAMLYPDSYGSRGLTSVCDIKLANRTVKLHVQVSDLQAAGRWLADQPFADKERIALIGWGTGGTAVLRILDPAIPLNQLVQFRAAIAFYPQCAFLTNSTNYVPVPLPSIHAGAADELAPAAPCKALAARWGSPITLYPGAYHNFEVPNTPVRKRKFAEGMVFAGTNSAARDKSIKATMETLKSAFAAARDAPLSPSAAPEPAK